MAPRFLIGFLLLASFCLGLLGCTPSPSHSDRPIQLQFWTLQLAEFAPFLQDTIAQYEAAHPTVRITWVDVPFSEGEKRALTAMLSHQVPDVINLNPAFAARLAAKQVLLPINQLLSPAQLATYLPLARQAATLPTGQLVGVPWYLTSKVLFVNQSLLTSPPPTTLGQVLTHLTHPHYVAQRHQPNAWALWYPPLASGGYFSKELLAMDAFTHQQRLQDLPTLLRSPQATQRLAAYQHAYQQGLLPAEVITATPRDSVQQYQAGRLALLEAGTSLVTQLKTNAPLVYQHSRVYPQLGAATGLVDLALMVLVVPKRSAHPQQAAQFAHYITNATNQLAFSQLAPVLPSQSSALHQYLCALRTAPTPSLLQQALLQSGQQVLTGSTTLPLSSQQATINDTLDLAVQQALLGHTPPQAALQQAAQRIAPLVTGD